MSTFGLNMNFEALSKLAAPATEKIRQLQKIVQDIKKNDGSLLDKLRRLKSKPRPNLPARDYRDDNREDDEFSIPEYDNDTVPSDDDSYEPPPSLRFFTTTPSSSLQRGEYVDSCHERPSQPPRRPLRPGKASKQLPPKPTHPGSDEDEYINPDAMNDDNYIQPEDDSSPTLYEIPDSKDGSSSPPANRLCLVSSKPSQPLPPKPSPRMNVRRCPLPVPQPSCDGEHKVCDPDNCGPPPLLPRPSPKEGTPKRPLGLKPETRPRESRTLPAVTTDPKPALKSFTMEYKGPNRIPQFTPPKPADRGILASENGWTEQDKDADTYNKLWYAATCDRKTADDALLRFNKDGGFLVRKSSSQDAKQPYTLVVFYSGRVYNIPIRCIPGTQQYALGRKKIGEKYFSSVSHIIENHQRHPLVLIDGQCNTKDTTRLSYPVTP